MDVVNESGELDKASVTECKYLVARANDLAVDRPDIQFICKEFSASMSSPSTAGYEKLKRLGRYLLGRPRVVRIYHKRKAPNHLVTNADANWA